MVEYHSLIQKLEGRTEPYLVEVRNDIMENIDNVIADFDPE
jgi:hypothetical protein